MPHLNLKKIALLLGLSLMSACTVGPDYKRPVTIVPTQYKETSKHWKVAKPQDEVIRGNWWEIFHDPALDHLEEQLLISNQTVANAAYNYQNALALVDEARASYYPVISGSASITRQKQGSGTGSSSFSSISSSAVSGSPVGTPSTSSGVATTGSKTHGNPYTSHSLLVNASWEPDIWGAVRRSVEASQASADSMKALLASTSLSAQGSLAQLYFEIRALDADQKLLDDTVREYKKALLLTNNRYNAGVAPRTDVLQAQSQLETAEAQAIDNKINRAKYEHAIAVLIGQPPELISIPARPLTAVPPRIPMSVPSELLERRPDIAQAERTMAAANAQIGVAVSAYFPTLTLSGSGSVTGLDYAHWFSIPALSWSLGPQLAATFWDGGLRDATIGAAKATYKADVASYRETVLSAFQDVEDNMASLRILGQEVIVQKRAARDALRALALINNEYKAGTVAYTDVITAQNTAYTAQKTAADVNGSRMVAAVGLVKALGGGWDVSCCRKKL